MRSTPMVSGVLISVFVTCGMAQTFKGHQIGEAPQQFFALEPRIGALLTSCKATIPKVLTDDQVQAKYGKKGFEKVHKAEMQVVASGKHVIGYYDQDPDVYGDRCIGVLNVSRGNGTINGNGHTSGNEFATELQQRWTITAPTAIPISDGNEDAFTFENGTLSYFKIQPVSTDEYVALRDDVTERVGVQPTMHTTPYQNGYGAKWEDVTYIWVTDKITVILTVENNPVRREAPLLAVGSKEYMQKIVNKELSKPKPLDR